MRPSEKPAWMGTARDRTHPIDHNGRPESAEGPRANAADAPALGARRLKESEARLRALIEASPLGIDIIDLDGNPIFYNPKAEELHGVSLEDARARGWSSAVHPEDRERVASSWYAAATEGRSWAETYRFLHPDGTIIWVSGRAAPIWVEGEMVGFVGTLEDVTPLIAAEQAARESEERFRTLGNAIPQLVWIVDSSGIPLWFNDRWYEYTGMSPEEIPDWNWRHFQHPEHAERVWASLQRALEKEERWEETFPLRAKTGEYRWFLTRAIPVHGAEGEVVRWFGTQTDVTASIEAAAMRERILEREREARGEAERRAREEQGLREAASALAAPSTTEEVIQRIASSAVTATNADGAFVERIDIRRGDVLIEGAAGRGIAAAGARIPYAGSFAEQVVEGGEAIIVERLATARHRLPGDLLHLNPEDSAIVVPLVDGGEPVGGLILLRGAEKSGFREDEIHRAQTFADLATLAFRRIHLLEESERRREELQRVMESRARLIRGFSHDVKNPLGAADGYLALLEEGIGGDISDLQRENVSRARRAIRSSLGLIKDLLELARAEAGQFELRCAPLDVRDAARDIGEEYRAQAEAKGLQMEIRLPDTLPVVESDAARVRQILGNLLSNAIKYTEKGMVRLSVQLRTRDDERNPGEWISAEVEDTGPGIRSDEQRLLFQEFSQLSPSGRGGAGIGLAISQRIARVLGGEITVASEEGRGSSFTLWLPCLRPIPERGE